MYQKLETEPYCETREQLLDAMSGGGRHGFEVPYYPRSVLAQNAFLDIVILTGPARLSLPLVQHARNMPNLRALRWHIIRWR